MAARRLMFRSSLACRESEDNSSGRIISSSFDLSYSSSRPIQRPPNDPQSKPRSMVKLRPPSQGLNLLQSLDASETVKDRKQSKTRPSTTNNSPLLSSARKLSNENNQKVTRRPRSTDTSKASQSNIAIGGNGTNGRNNMAITQRSSAVSTTKFPSLSSSSQSIILFCMDNARSDIALRIIQRMAHKRDDFAQFYANLNSEQSAELVVTLKKFLSDIVQNVGSPEKIKEISNKYGVEQAHKRSWGFKADFFAVLADALTTECVFLDGAAHQPTDTIEAWATLVELMFTHVRDGYYQQIRQLRRNLQNFSSHSNVSSQSDQSFEGDSLQLQPSPSSRHTFTIVQNSSTTNSDCQNDTTRSKFSPQLPQSSFLRS